MNGLAGLAGLGWAGLSSPREDLLRHCKSDRQNPSAGSGPGSMGLPSRRL